MVGRVAFEGLAGVWIGAAPGGAGMAILLSQDGQLMRIPLHSGVTRICWPQVGQSNLNSAFVGMASVFMLIIYPISWGRGHWRTPGAGLSETLTSPISRVRSSELMLS